MNKNYLLGGLLAIQAVAGYIILAGGGDLQEHSGIQKLVEFERETLDGIKIEDVDGNIVELKRVDDAWVSADDFPADSDRVDRLLDRLVELEHGLAIASSSSAAERFEVSEDSFQRRIDLLDGDKVLSSLYLGTGAGARRSHVRLAGEDSIYTATIGTFEFPAEISEWQDKTVLNLDFDSVKTVEFEGLKVSRIEVEQSDSENDEEADSDGPAWSIEVLADKEEFDHDAFESALRSLVTLRFNEASNGSTEDLDLKGEFAVDYGNVSRDYQFYRSEDDGVYLLSVSDYDKLFEISDFNGNRILNKLSRQELVSIPETTEAEEISEESNLEEKPEAIEGTGVNEESESVDGLKTSDEPDPDDESLDAGEDSSETLD